jgi:hypothetical protein
MTQHSDEHLVSSNRGIAVLRHLSRRQLHAVAEGPDPARVKFNLDVTPIAFEAGNE